jgi:hypothetical protein
MNASGITGTDPVRGANRTGTENTRRGRGAPRPEGSGWREIPPSGILSERCEAERWPTPIAHAPAMGRTLHGNIKDAVFRPACLQDAQGQRTFTK